MPISQITCHYSGRVEAVEVVRRAEYSQLEIS